MNASKYRDMYNDGDQVNTIGFFGGKDSKETGPKMLSNFYPSTFRAIRKGRELTFSCNEQFFMWAKAMVFNCEDTALKILELDYNPSKYKKLGRYSISNYDDEIWDNVRDSYMKMGLRMKFRQDKSLRDYLLSTGNSVLIETNPRDKVWSCGLSIDSNYRDPNSWTGENKLGFLLMEIREELRGDE